MRTLKLFVCGDVMTGRGVDQILAHPSEPTLYERHVQSAGDYVVLAEAINGPIRRPVGPSYVWGDAKADLARRAPDARIINLETAVTASDDWEPKGINYRMHPANVDILETGQIDCCVLSNNHVLDWGRGGLLETLDALRSRGLTCAGAGTDQIEAARPGVVSVRDGRRVLVFAFGHSSSGSPPAWRATTNRSGVNLISDLSTRSAERVLDLVAVQRRPGDLVVVSLHWGGNWGHQIPHSHVEFAHRLMDADFISLVHGHSSHHPKSVEIYRNRLILYGCGDFLNDYEGIRGHRRYRPDLAVAYLPAFVEGHLTELELLVYRIERFRLRRASRDDARWIVATLDEISDPFGTRIHIDDQGKITAAPS